jgi:hypothetical protein
VVRKGGPPQTILPLPGSNGVGAGVDNCIDVPTAEAIDALTSGLRVDIVTEVRAGVAQW